jgi:proteasome maturation protein
MYNKHPRLQGPIKAAAQQRSMLAHMYGIAMPAQMDIECQILSRQRRLPGLPSSNLGLEILTGK